MMLNRPRLPRLLALLLPLVLGGGVVLADEPAGASSAAAEAEQTEPKQTESVTAESDATDATNQSASTVEESAADGPAATPADGADPDGAKKLDGATSNSASADLEPPAAQPPVAEPAIDPLAPGQADLDKAMELKLLAGNRGGVGSTLRDLNKIVELLDAAIEKGLEPDNEKFANSMLVGTLMQRATGLSAAVLNRPKDSPKSDMRWLQVRQFALTDLQRVLEIDPAAARANLLIARLQFTQFGDPNAARRALNKVIASDPEAVEPTERAQAYALRGAAERDADKRLADLSKAVELAPGKTDYLIARARQLHQQKKYDAAMKDVDAVLAVTPENVTAHELRALVLLGQYKPAEAIESFDRATELAPNNLTPYQLRGEAYNRLGDRQKAIEQLDKAIAIDPDNPGSRLVRSQLYLMDDRPEDALADVEAVLARQPGLLRAHLLRVQVLNKLDRQEDAMEALRRIGQAAPDRPEVLLQLAVLYQGLGEMDESIDTLNRVLDQDGKNLAALRLRGDTYLTTGDHTNALEDFARAYEIKPDDSGLLNNYAWTLATSPFDDLRDGQRAIELATRAAELTDFDKPHIISTLAAAHAEVGNFERAIELAEKAVNLEKEQGGSPEAGPNIDDQLSRELASYRSGKPWRELQQGSPEEPPAIAEPTPDSPAGDDPLDRAFDF